jgi:predicted Zn-ribbon and HTH transcriptional regulator
MTVINLTKGRNNNPNAAPHAANAASSAHVTLPERECLRCGYRWHPRQAKPPVLCPSCRSSLWNQPRVTEFPERTCAGCGHTWKPKSARPKRCRRCGQEVDYARKA